MDHHSSESVPLVLPYDSPPHSPVDERKKSIGELTIDEVISSPSSSPGSSPDTSANIQMMPTRKSKPDALEIGKRGAPDSPDFKHTIPDSPPKSPPSALLSRRLSERKRLSKAEVIITIQTKEDEAKSPRRMSERRRSSILFPKHSVQSPLPHCLDEVAPYEAEQVFGRATIQSPLPSALRRPSIKAGLELHPRSLVGKAGSVK